MKTRATSGIQDFYTPCLTFGVVERAVCGHPEQFLFWDAIHPTRAGYKLTAHWRLQRRATGE